jgi:hypothetical protein
VIDTPYSRWREFDRSEPPSHLEVHFRGGIEDGYTLHTRPEHWLPDRHDLAAESMRGQRKLTLVFDDERDAYVWQEAPAWLGVVSVPHDVARPAGAPDTSDDGEDDTEVGEPAIRVRVTLRGRLLAQTAASVPEEILAIGIPELRDAAMSEWGTRLRGDFRAMVQHMLDGRGNGETIDADEAEFDEEVLGDR